MVLWCGAGLNRRHKDFQSFALPTELPHLKKLLLINPIPMRNDIGIGLMSNNFLRCGSSVGRAKDWKSLCRRFNPAPHHKTSAEMPGFCFISNGNTATWLKILVSSRWISGPTPQNLPGYFGKVFYFLSFPIFYSLNFSSNKPFAYYRFVVFDLNKMCLIL